MKLSSKYCKLVALATSILLAVPGSSQAAVVLNLQQVGSDIVLSMNAGGSINPNSGADGPSYSTPLSGSLLNDASLPGFLVILGSGSGYGTFFFSGVSGPSLFGTGPAPLFASTSDTGAVFGFLVINSTAALVVPSGHTVGTALGAASSTFAGTSFASLGIAPGSYVWTVGTNPNTDTITLNVGGGASVPESASLLVPAMAVSALGVVQMRRRSRKP